MLIIYLLVKLEQYLCKEYLRTLYPYEYLLVLPIYLLPLNLISCLLLEILFVLSWMDHRILSISDRLIVLFYCVICIQYLYHPIHIDYSSIFICLFLALFSKYTKGMGLGDIYILFGLSFILNLTDFLTVLRYSFIIALIINVIKKTKEPFAFIPYIYLSLILFLSGNLY